MDKKIFLAAVVSLFTAAIAFAQTQSQQILSSDKGLSSTLIGDILQDRNGNLWIATENGLNRYNGVKFKSYFHDDNDPNSLNSNYVRTLFEARDGQLYIGTRAGIQIYDPATDSFSLTSTFSNGEPSYNIVNHIIQRKNGDIISSGNILARILIKNGNPVIEQIEAGEFSIVAEEVFEDSKERLWITKEGCGVLRLDPDGSSHNYHIKADEEPFTLCMKEDKNGNILAGSLTDGIFRFDEAKDDFVTIYDEKCIVRKFFVNNETETLICTDGKGMKVFDNTTGKISDYPIEMEQNEAKKAKVHCVTKDNQGNLWMAIYQHGALMIPAEKTPFHFFGSKSHTNDIIGRCCVMTVRRGSNGETFVGTDNDGLYIVAPDKKSSIHLSHEDNPDIPSIVIGLYEDSRHNLWIGSYGAGALVLDLKTMKCKKVEGLHESGNEKEPAKNVYDFVEDADGRIWIATMGGGLHCFNPKTKKIESCDEINNVVSSWICSIEYSQKTNSLLIGSYDGLWRIGLSNLGNENEQILETSIIHDVCEDPDGVVWAATSDGLARWGGNSKGISERNIIMFSPSDGLPSNICYAVENDNMGTIWVSTGHGLVRMNRETFKLTNFFVEDGLQGNEFSKNASTFDRKTGEIYFGGVNGVTWFNPSDILITDHKWKVHIADMYVAGNPIKVGTKSGGRDIIENAVYEADDFYLSHQDNAFTIEIGTNDMTNSDKKVFYYAMDNDKWIALPKGDTQVSFSNLPPGTYRFKAKVVEGAVESDVRTVKIHIRAAWWQSWWMILITIGLIAYIIYYILEQIRHRRLLRIRMFHHIQSERHSESKLQFLTNVSHEIRTPMTLIINPLQQLIDTDKDETRQHSYRLMQRNADRIMSLVNQLMDVRKIEHGQLRMKMKETELGSYLENLKNTFAEIAGNRDIALSFHKMGVEELSAWIDTENFDKVVMNLLSNAFKYTPEGGSIEIFLSKIDNSAGDDAAGKFAEIVVKDSGVGIPEGELNRVFERFFQAKNKKSGSGTGVGLHLTRSIVQMHHGTISAKNNDDGPGCRFIVRIPLGNAHLSPTEIAEVKAEPKVVDEKPVVEVKTAEVKPTETKPQTPVMPQTQPTAKVEEEEDNRYVVLVAEDDDEIREYLSTELQDEYIVVTCENGAEALNSVMTSVPDIIISDVMMPEMDGYTLLKKIRQNINFNALPFILLTAKSMNEDQIHGLELGADAYVTKPFNIRLLRQNIASLLQSRRTLRNIYSGSQAQEGKVEEIKVATPDEILVEKVMKVINDNISNSELSVEEIAKEVGVSRVHLHRKLKRLTNQSTRDLIRNQRITLAAKLLREKRMPITEVAYLVGFSSPAHFTTSFKAMYGMSPSLYTATHNADPAQENSIK